MPNQDLTADGVSVTPVERRARVHVGVHYQWYLRGMTDAYATGGLRGLAKGPRVPATTRLQAYDTRRDALRHRAQALDAVWILTGKWQG